MFHFISYYSFFFVCVCVMFVSLLSGDVFDPVYYMSQRDTRAYRVLVVSLPSPVAPKWMTFLESRASITLMISTSFWWSYPRCTRMARSTSRVLTFWSCQSRYSLVSVILMLKLEGLNWIQRNGAAIGLIIAAVIGFVSDSGWRIDGGGNDLRTCR